MTKKCVTHRLASSVKKASLLAIILLVKELAKCHKRYHTGIKPLIGTSNTTDEVQINIECDRIASETTQEVLKGGISPPDPVISLPYAGSKAMFRIRGRWITSKVKTEIKRARRSPAIKAYMMEKYGWDNATFESIHGHPYYLSGRT